MKKRVFKILLILIVCIGCIFLVTSTSYADGSSGKDLVDKFGGASNADVNDLAKQTVSPVLSVVRIVGIGLSLIMITYLAIKYMTGAASDKGIVKEQIIALAIGLTIIVTAPTLFKIAKSVAGNMFPDSSEETE